MSLSWVVTGRQIFSINYGKVEFEAVAERFLAAARAMERDGWWAGPETTNKAIRRGILKEMFQHRRSRRRMPPA